MFLNEYLLGARVHVGVPSGCGILSDLRYFQIWGFWV